MFSNTNTRYIILHQPLPYRQSFGILLRIAHVLMYAVVFIHLLRINQAKGDADALSKFIRNDGSLMHLQNSKLNPLTVQFQFYSK